MSDEDIDENEHQEAGGKNRGGKVGGAHGGESKEEGNKSGGQGTLGNRMSYGK